MGRFATKLVYIRGDNWHDKKHHLQGLLLIWPKTQLVISGGGCSLSLLYADQRFCHHRKKLFGSLSVLEEGRGNPDSANESVGDSFPQPCLRLFRPGITGLQNHLHFISNSHQVAQLTVQFPKIQEAYWIHKPQEEWALVVQMSSCFFAHFATVDKVLW